MIFLNSSNPKQRLAEVFSEQDNPIEFAKRWAREIASEKKLDISGDWLLLLRAIRSAEPALDLKSACYLCQMIAKEP